MQIHILSIILAGYAAYILANPYHVFSFTYDDSFYYFEIANRIYKGQGSTFDGINATNGYHPLWMLVCIAVGLLNLRPFQMVQFILILQLVIFVFVILEVKKLFINSSKSSAKNLIAGISVILISTSPGMLRVFINGMESVTVVLFFAMLLTGTKKPLPEISKKEQLRFGIISTLLFLSRTDAILLIPSVFITFMLTKKTTPRERVAGFLRCVGPLFAVFLLYSLINYFYFGTLFQISGMVKRLQLEIEGALCLVFVTIILLLLIKALGEIKLRSGDDSVSLPDFINKTSWAIALIVLQFSYYSFAQNQIWLWYFAPAALYISIVLSFLFSEIIEAGIISGRIWLSSLFSVAIYLVIVIATFQTLFSPYLSSIQIANFEAASWIEHNIDKKDVIASWDAGVLGYFSSNNVINLDGVVNSLLWLEAGNSKEQAKLLRNWSVKYVVNHGYYSNGQNESILNALTEWFGKKDLINWDLIRSFPFIFSGTFEGTVLATSSRTTGVFVYGEKTK